VSRKVLGKLEAKQMISGVTEFGAVKLQFVTVIHIDGLSAVIVTLAQGKDDILYKAIAATSIGRTIESLQAVGYLDVFQAWIRVRDRAAPIVKNVWQLLR